MRYGDALQFANVFPIESVDVLCGRNVNRLHPAEENRHNILGKFQNLIQNVTKGVNFKIKK